MSVWHISDVVKLTRERFSLSDHKHPNNTFSNQENIKGLLLPRPDTHLIKYLWTCVKVMQLVSTVYRRKQGTVLGRPTHWKNRNKRLSLVRKNLKFPIGKALLALSNRIFPHWNHTYPQSLKYMRLSIPILVFWPFTLSLTAKWLEFLCSFFILSFFLTVRSSIRKIYNYDFLTLS